jgi:DNA-binding NtrC family response regulator
MQTHKGFIDVESELGKGTTFRLYFPVSKIQEVIKVKDEKTLEEIPGGTETILLIEDEEALKEMVHLMLESKGYKVFTAQDGKEAIRVYKEHKEEINIVLTDMGLPAMIGTEVFKKLKELNPNVRVILASGFFEPDIKPELYKSGVKGFIQKPYSPDEVLRKLREVLDTQE